MAGAEPIGGDPTPQAEVVPVLDFGGQYAQLIARRVREAGAYSLLLPPDTSIDELARLRPKGIILSGGPASVCQADAPRCDDRLFELGVPVLGICYGMQLGAQILGCEVNHVTAREFGRARLEIHEATDLLADIPANTTVWTSHGDQIQDLGDQFEILASTPSCPFAAVRHRRLPFDGVQFHPESRTRRTATTCFETSSTGSASAPARGKWPTSWRPSASASASGSATLE